ncbi:hypothetical protein [Rufibacter ruber]|uniref:hypothetical protein n=1 Tax=Rufibacter ruber TaxID=1783499 RepID=UPI00082CA7C0|nr:hypothetical protein [Rufibacter ruber]
MSANQLDREIQAVAAVFNGFLKHQEFKAIAERSLLLVQESGYRKILVDTSQAKVIQLKSQHWIDREWFPRAEAAGVTHLAFLTPEDFFGKMSIEATNKLAQQKSRIVIAYFTAAEDARRWLQAQS